MTRKDALAELIAKVEAGAGIEYSTYRKALDGIDGRFSEMDYPILRDVARRAFHGSLDAAMALHQSVLPVAWAYIRHTGKYGHCTLDVDGDEYEANNCDTPARAWLLAVLKALLSKEADT